MLLPGAAALLAVVALVAAVRALPLPRRGPSNVVLVVVDALRRDHVGPYGYHAPTTPFLDELAARGAVFENAWSHAPHTFNATAALLTGRVARVVEQVQVLGRDAAQVRVPGERERVVVLQTDARRARVG